MHVVETLPPNAEQAHRYLSAVPTDLQQLMEPRLRLADLKIETTRPPIGDPSVLIDTN